MGSEVSWWKVASWCGEGVSGWPRELIGVGRVWGMGRGKFVQGLVGREGVSWCGG